MHSVGQISVKRKKGNITAKGEHYRYSSRSYLTPHRGPLTTITPQGRDTLATVTVTRRHGGPGTHWHIVCASVCVCVYYCSPLRLCVFQVCVCVFYCSTYYKAVRGCAGALDSHFFLKKKLAN